jgi:hypothetical protein
MSACIIPETHTIAIKLAECIQLEWELTYGGQELKEYFDIALRFHVEDTREAAYAER